jgi:hypothetical protein
MGTRGWLAICAGVAIGCGGSGAGRRARPASTPVPVATPLEPVAPEAGVLDEEVVARELCDGRPGCRFENAQSAGGGEQERDLWVVSLRLPATEDRWCDVGGPPEVAPLPAEGPGPTEHWLVVARGARVESSQLLLDLCNDGYGAAGAGEDEVAIHANKLEHTQSGGSAWRWSTTTLVQLAPLAIEQETSGGDWSLNPDNREESTWSWVDFAGTVDWSSPFCDACGNPPFEEIECNRPPAEPGNAEGNYVQVPRAQVPPEMDPGAWRTTSLGACAALVDGGEHGHTVHGTAGGAADASMRVVASTRGVLYVEVRDDHFVTGSRRWIDDDHVELWVGSSELGYMEHCIDRHPTTTGLRQWGVRISDAAIRPGHGRPQGPLVAATAVEGNVARVRIELPEHAEAVTVVYSDGDDGHSPESLIATSKLRFGHPESLGALRAISPEVAVCELREGRLEPRITRTFRRDQPVVTP